MKVITDTLKTVGAIMVMMFALNVVMAGVDASMGVDSDKAAYIDAALTK